MINESQGNWTTTTFEPLVYKPKVTAPSNYNQCRLIPAFTIKFSPAVSLIAPTASIEPTERISSPPLVENPHSAVNPNSIQLASVPNKIIVESKSILFIQHICCKMFCENIPKCVFMSQSLLELQPCFFFFFKSLSLFYLQPLTYHQLGYSDSPQHFLIALDLGDPWRCIKMCFQTCLS